MGLSVHNYDDSSTHVADAGVMNGLGQGNVDGDKVICPWHEWAYDCRTGVNDFDENVKLTMFPVMVDGDDILIDVP